MYYSDFYLMKKMPNNLFNSYQISHEARIRKFELRIECEYDLEKRKDVAKVILDEVHANVHCLMFRVFYKSFESETFLNLNETFEKVGYPPNYYEAQKQIDENEGYAELFQDLTTVLDTYNESVDKYRKGIEVDFPFDKKELDEITKMFQYYEQSYRGEMSRDKVFCTKEVQNKYQLIMKYQTEEDDIHYLGVVAWFYFEKEFYDYVLKRYNELKSNTPENVKKVIILNQENVSSQYQANPPSPPQPSKLIAKGKMTWNTDVKHLVNLFNSLKDKISDGTPLLEATDEAIMYFIIHKFLNKHSKPFEVADLQKYFDGHTTPKNQKIRWNGEIVELCYIFRELYKPLEKGSTIYLSTKKETLKDNIHEYFVWKADDQEINKGTLGREMTPARLQKIKREHKHDVKALMKIVT